VQTKRPAARSASSSELITMTHRDECEQVARFAAAHSQARPIADMISIVQARENTDSIGLDLHHGHPIGPLRVMPIARPVRFDRASAFVYTASATVRTCLPFHNPHRPGLFTGHKRMAGWNIQERPAARLVYLR